ncbi:hypothetical protein BCR35DRAFT_13586 [Leucosporidium creatinivorum]|uniref:Uncharacterized protein n=1 Tax=Leucosporidium creatinivorum TaxID=106004 RepID=A0A1Y2FWJ9_9BASI|nr:hypothetical protein BCR35DRAFT_13586 [Leucosporidium creatinivorum]
MLGACQKLGQPVIYLSTSVSSYSAATSANEHKRGRRDVEKGEGGSLPVDNCQCCALMRPQLSSMLFSHAPSGSALSLRLEFESSCLQLSTTELWDEQEEVFRLYFGAPPTHQVFRAASSGKEPLGALFVLSVGLAAHHTLTRSSTRHSLTHMVCFRLLTPLPRPQSRFNEPMLPFLTSPSSAP